MSASQLMYSLVIPVYGNEGSIPELIDVVADLNKKLDEKLEAVFVVDGSPDRSYALLRERLPKAPFKSQLHLLSRNFGSFSAIRAGLAQAKGTYYAVMAADLQEPPELVLESFTALTTEEYDVCVGTRSGRADPFFSRLSSNVFWSLYRRFVQPQMPAGGVDVFACTKPFRDSLLAIREANTSLIGLIFWLGYRRKLISYQRRARKHGVSGWTFKKKLRYLSDSVFSFSDLPVRLLWLAGSLAVTAAIAFGAVVLALRLLGDIAVPGYTATILTILFFAGLNSLGLGLIGSYVWRAFENTKARPESVVLLSDEFAGRS